MVARALAVGLCLATLLAVCRADAAADLITDLPGLPSPAPFKQYAGYITVDASHGRKLFYWLQESTNDPATDPLVLWLNGGPGCSSVGGGLMSENGAFQPNANGTLDYNPWSWNRAANMVFLKSPAGVGFSFSDDTADYTVGDNRTAHDTYNFLQGFMDRFPQYQGRPFWVTGESYGGHYVPDISNLIVKMNNAGMRHINFQGFMVGNAWTDAAIDNTGAVFDWYSHNLIAEDTYNGVLANCNMSNIGPLAMDMSKEAAAAAGGDDCVAYQVQAQQQMGSINIYDIYVDVCVGDDEASPRRAAQATSGSDTPAGGRIGYDPCIGNEVTTFLNRKDVQTAIHANTTLGYAWSDCSPRLNYSRDSLLSSMLPIYRQLLDAGIKILVYSGDVDAIVPTPGTRAWLAKLDLTVSKPWRPWTTEDSQVGGYVTVYDKLTFTTVRNAGHMVPYMQPARAYHMFTSFLTGQSF